MTEVKILERIQGVIFDLVDCDQDAAVCEVMYRPASKESLLVKLDKSLKELADIRNIVKELDKKSYNKTNS